ncbi:MAG: glycosyltransferase family 4 protein [Acidimicrobiales bacterium]
MSPRRAPSVKETEQRPLGVTLDLLPLLGAPTGIGVFTRGLLEALSARGDVAVGGYAAGLGARGISSLVAQGTALRTWRVPARVLNALWRRLPVPSAELVAGSTMVVHGTNFVVPPCRRAAAVATVPDLFCLHFPEQCAPSSRAYPDLVRRQLARGAFVHTMSDFVAAEVLEAFGAAPDRVRAIPIGIGPPTGAGAARSDGATGAGPTDVGAGTASAATVTGQGPEPTRPFEWPYVLAVGTVEPRKDYPSLVAAFSQLPASLHEVRLVIAGADGWGAAQLREAIAASPAAGRIVRLGYVAPLDNLRLLESACVLAYPSIYEGFGLPPLEAMAAGVPVVTTDGGALGEIAGDGALLVPTRDPGALASALEAVLTDSSLRADLLARGRRRASGFGWDSCAEAMVGLYNDAFLATSTGPGARRWG